MEFGWNPDESDLFFGIVNSINELAQKQMPDLAEVFPFRSAWNGKDYWSETWMAVCLEGSPGASAGRVPSVGRLDEEEVRILKRLVLPFGVRTFQQVFQILGTDWFSFNKFTYVGPCKDGHLSWPHVLSHLIGWLNQFVVPEVLRLNATRVLRAIPKPPQFDISAINQALWVLECEETFKQGTAFMLSGVGMVTCEHVIGSNTHAFRPDRLTEKYPVEVVARHAVIDLAVLKIDAPSSPSFTRGSADTLKQMDHIVIAGFPNFRYGDTGTIVPGLVVGFRMVSSIRRILTNAAIISGNSGGPVLDGGHRVIGVAVTGVERMEAAQKTENHGIIPVDALQFFWKQNDA